MDGIASEQDKDVSITARYNGNANYAGSKAACQVTVKEKKSQTGGGTLIPPEKPTPEEPTPEKPDTGGNQHQKNQATREAESGRNRSGSKCNTCART